MGRSVVLVILTFAGFKFTLKKRECQYFVDDYNTKITDAVNRIIRNEGSPHNTSKIHKNKHGVKLQRNQPRETF